MTLDTRKNNVIGLLLQSQDEQFIMAMELALKNRLQKDKELKLSKEQHVELVESVRQGEEDIKNGNTISLEDLEEQMKDW